MIERLAEYHKEWLDIAYSFLNNKEDAEDLVQEMYLRYAQKELIKEDAIYGVNKYYVYLTLKSMALDSIKKKKPDLVYVDYINDLKHEHEEYNESYLLKEIDIEMQNWSWYDRTIFEIYMYTELSMRDLAYGSSKTPRSLSTDRRICDSSVLNGANISLSSIYNTIKLCKERLRAKISTNTKNEI